MDFRYDSNIITRADEATVAVSDKDSFVWKTDLRATYRGDLGDKWRITAEMKGIITLHSERSNSDIFTNDNINIWPALRFNRPHRWWGDDFEHIINTEVNYTLQDYKKLHEFSYYSRFVNLEFGQRGTIWDTGKSTIRFDFKFYQSYDDTLDSVTYGLYFNQKFKLGEDKLSTTVETDFLQSRTASKDTVTYKLNNRYPIAISLFGADYKIIPKLNFWIIDTKRQRSSRGYERRINPSLTLRRRVGAWIWKLGYEYTRVLSQDKANFQYKRNEVFLNAAYRF